MGSTLDTLDTLDTFFTMLYQGDFQNEKANVLAITKFTSAEADVFKSVNRNFNAFSPSGQQKLALWNLWGTKIA